MKTTSRFVVFFSIEVVSMALMLVHRVFRLVEEMLRPFDEQLHRKTYELI